MSVENKARQILDGLLFPKIFRSFRMSVQPSQLIIAFLLIAAIGLAGWIMDLPKTVVTTPGTNGHETELSMYMTPPRTFRRILKNTPKKAGARVCFRRCGIFQWKNFTGL